MLLSRSTDVSATREDLSMLFNKLKRYLELNKHASVLRVICDTISWVPDTYATGNA